MALWCSPIASRRDAVPTVVRRLLAWAWRVGRQNGLQTPHIVDLVGEVERRIARCAASEAGILTAALPPPLQRRIRSLGRRLVCPTPIRRLGGAVPVPSTVAPPSRRQHQSRGHRLSASEPEAHRTRSLNTGSPRPKGGASGVEIVAPPGRRHLLHGCHRPLLGGQLSPLGCPLAEPFLPEGSPVRSRHVDDYSMAATGTLPVFIPASRRRPGAGASHCPLSTSG
jgi:hypothetical protein